MTATEAAAEDATNTEANKAHAENWDECYIEIIAKPAKKSVTPQKSEEAE
jgi:hypothetical protein